MIALKTVFEIEKLLLDYARWKEDIFESVPTGPTPPHAQSCQLPFNPLPSCLSVAVNLRLGSGVAWTTVTNERIILNETDEH